MAEIAAKTVNAFLMPGEAVLSLIGAIAPEAEAIMRIDYGATIYPLIFSLIAWTAVLVIGLYVVKIVKNLAWQTSALVHTFIYWVRNSLGNIKTRLLWQYRRFFPHQSDDTQLVSQEEFDKLDIAVLRTLFKKGPAIAASAPELAEVFTLRPAQVQRRLEKLAQNHMLRTVIGSTDGYDNYRLTDSGLTFITMMQRQARMTANVSPVSASGTG
jgi:DNA-binding MarR family transcriptional regulator